MSLLRCLASAAALAALACSLASATAAGACPDLKNPIRCVAAPGYALPDINAVMAADATVPALTMKSFDGSSTVSALQMLPYTDIVRWWGALGRRAALHAAS